MKLQNIEIVAGSLTLAALTGVAIATYAYKHNHNFYNRVFDKNTVEELKGKIDDIVYTGRENGKDKGVEMILHSGDVKEIIHLGPVWFMEKQNGKFKKGDKVQVRGSRIIYEGLSVIVAELITRGGKEFRMRNELGHPLWNAWVEGS